MIGYKLVEVESLPNFILEVEDTSHEDAHDNLADTVPLEGGGDIELSRGI
jgi:hypothetical protein